MNRYLLADIAEMLELPDAAPMPHRDGGVHSVFETDGIRVWMHHDDLECSTVRIVITTADRRQQITEATINDCFNGELVAEFVRSFCIRYVDLAQVK
jgi:hypothetical protein